MKWWNIYYSVTELKIIFYSYFAFQDVETHVATRSNIIPVLRNGIQ